MYGRFQRSVYECLICDQRRGVRPPWHISVASLHISPPQRAAFPAESLTQGIEHELPDNDGVNSRRIKRPRKFKIRHWVPPNAAQLGIESLGTPAEVLLLPARDPELFRMVVQSDDAVTTKDQRGLPLLEGEATTLSWPDIKQNMVAARDMVVKTTADKKYLKPEKWTELRGILSQGFSREHLKKYLVEHEASVHERGLVRDNFVKRELATSIMTELWGLERVLETSTNTAQGSGIAATAKTRHYSKVISINSTALDVALLNEGKALREVSDALGVKIDVFRDESRIRLSGAYTSVLAARKQLNRFFQQLKRTIVSMSDGLRALAQTPHFSGFLKMLTQRYAVQIEQKNNTLLVHSPNAVSLNLVRQELTKFSRSEHRNTRFSLLGGHQKLSELTRAQVYPTNLQHWFLEQQLWYRHITGKLHLVHEQMTLLRAAAAKVEQKLKSAKLPSARDVVSTFTLGKSNVKLEQFADLGHVLFNEDKSVPLSLQSTFSCNIPSITRLLTSSSTGIKPLRGTQTILLQLKPRDVPFAYPSLDIHMTCENIANGLNQPLTISKVDLVFGSAFHDVLLPTATIDARIHQRVVFELFNAAGDAPLPQYLLLLQALSNIVHEIQVRKQSSTSPVHTTHKLDLRALFPDAFRMHINTDCPNQTEDSMPLTESTMEALSKIEARQTKPVYVHYVEDQLRCFDMAVYTHPRCPGFLIEHTLTTSIPDGQSHIKNTGGGYSQTLRIIPQTLTSASESAPASAACKNPTIPAGKALDVATTKEELSPAQRESTATINNGNPVDAFDESKDATMERLLGACIDISHELTELGRVDAVRG